MKSLNTHLFYNEYFLRGFIERVPEIQWRQLVLVNKLTSNVIIDVLKSRTSKGSALNCKRIISNYHLITLNKYNLRLLYDVVVLGYLYNIQAAPWLKKCRRMIIMDEINFYNTKVNSGVDFHSPQEHVLTAAYFESRDLHKNCSRIDDFFNAFCKVLRRDYPEKFRLRIEKIFTILNIDRLTLINFDRFLNAYWSEYKIKSALL